MNAPAPIVADPIATFLPGCDGEELHLRRRLARARDIASSRVRTARSSDAQALLWMIVQTATAWLFASAPQDELQDAINHCVRLFMCAGFSERLEVEHADLG